MIVGDVTGYCPPDLSHHPKSGNQLKYPHDLTKFPDIKFSQDYCEKLANEYAKEIGATEPDWLRKQVVEHFVAGIRKCEEIRGVKASISI